PQRLPSFPTRRSSDLPTDNGLSIESQMLLEAQERNLRIREVRIDARYDIEGSSLSPTKHGTGVLGRIITIVSEKRPLFVFGVSRSEEHTSELQSLAYL